MAAGGQGAPLVPLFHQNILKKQSSDTALVNIGGIANITYVEETLLGYDIGPGNCLVDAWCQRNLNKPYDDKGRWARTGKLNVQLLKRLLNEQYFYLEPPKSTGKELFNLDWLKKNTYEYQLAKTSSQDVQRTLLELTAVTISKSVKNTPKVSNVIVCGGGRKNEFLMERISSLLNLEDKRRYVLDASEHWGLDGDSLEASAFASWPLTTQQLGRSSSISYGRKETFCSWSSLHKQRRVAASARRGGVGVVDIEPRPFKSSE